MSDELRQKSIDILSDLIAFDSTSAYSNLDLIAYIQNHLDKLYIAHRLTFNEEKNKANLWATIGPVDRGGIVLSGHTDVVPVAGQDWQSNPFQLSQRDNKLYGRGTCDMKGFIACALAHTQEFKQQELLVPIHFAFSYDEEVGCLGVRELIADMQENLPTPTAVIVGEPTSMKIVGGSKGGRGYITRVQGLEGHSSLPDLGVNAIVYAAKIIRHLEGIQNRLKEQADPSNGFIPPYSTLDLGIISGGTASNIIPAVCEFYWGFRGLPFENMDALENEVLAFIRREIEPAMQSVSPHTGVTTEMRNDVPALEPDEHSAAERVVRHLTQLNESGRVSYGTEAGHFQAAGVPGVIFGPGSIEQAHLPDEYIDISQMHECSDFMSKLALWATNPEA